MRKILLVESSTVTASLIKKKLEAHLELSVTVCRSFAGVRQLLHNSPSGYFLAILNMTLSDAESGEAVDYVIDKGIRTVVFSGWMDAERRQELFAKGIVDYVIKEGEQSLDYVAELVSRLARNQGVEVLVVDDSGFLRKRMSCLLELYNFRVHEAGNGLEALAALEAHPAIRMLLTDYNMPEMDGYELTQRVRRTHRRDQLAIIGLSASDSALVSATFLKKGANDFIHKPFSEEELAWRVNQTIDSMEYINRIRDASERDYLTGIYNRRHFFEAGSVFLEQHRSAGVPTALLMCDIDHFKKINDTYGHPIGDEAIRAIAKVLHTRFKAPQLVARLGGEEFAVLLTGPQAATLEDSCRDLLGRVREIQLGTEQAVVRFTISIGAIKPAQGNLEKCLDEVDHLLYRAKQAGRDRAVLPDGVTIE